MSSRVTPVGYNHDESGLYVRVKVSNKKKVLCLCDFSTEKATIIGKTKGIMISKVQKYLEEFGFQPDDD